MADAFAPLKRLLRKEPHHQHALFLLGTAHSYAGNHAEAARQFARYVESVVPPQLSPQTDPFSAPRIHRLTQLAPTFTRAFVGLGFAHLNLEDYTMAQESCDHATSLNPDDRQAWLCAANVADLNDDLDEAVAFLHKALALRPDKKTYFLLADAYRRLGDSEASEDGKVEAEESQRDVEEQVNGNVEGLVDFLLDQEVPPHLRP
jgi:tetratricopeptide (TPR) repeat protein